MSPLPLLSLVRGWARERDILPVGAPGAQPDRTAIRRTTRLLAGQDSRIVERKSKPRSQHALIGQSAGVDQRET